MRFKSVIFEAFPKRQCCSGSRLTVSWDTITFGFHWVSFSSTNWLAALPALWSAALFRSLCTPGSTELPLWTVAGFCQTSLVSQLPASAYLWPCLEKAREQPSHRSSFLCLRLGSSPNRISQRSLSTVCWCLFLSRTVYWCQTPSKLHSCRSKWFPWTSWSWERVRGCRSREPLQLTRTSLPEWLQRLWCTPLLQKSASDCPRKTAAKDWIRCQKCEKQRLCDGASNESFFRQYR